MNDEFKKREKAFEHWALEQHGFAKGMNGELLFFEKQFVKLDKMVKAFFYKEYQKFYKETV